MTDQNADDALEQLIGRALQIGLLTAASVVALGGLLTLLHGIGSEDLHRFNDATSSYRTVPSILSGARNRQGEALVMLGILLLILTPIARVAFMLGAFVLRRDRLYVLLSAVVLAMLLVGLVA